jgi:succinate-semialdehyde dehydrogenase / glutarate-semialdehyde dehydrogenase
VEAHVEMTDTAHGARLNGTTDLLRTKAYVRGRWMSATSKKTFAVHCPANEARVAEVADCGAAEARDAIEAAREAADPWRFRLASERAQLLRRWFELIEQHREALAGLITLEQGKPLSEARGEVDYAASFVHWFAEEASRVYGDTQPATAYGRRVLIYREPVGVVAAITPWNFPSAMVTRKVAPALAAGCTVVVKPAEETPLSALALAELSDQAGFPPGVFNVLPCARPVDVARELTSSQHVRKLSFTGSTEIGKLLTEQCASTVKRISLELGGNAPFIVFADADLDAAVEGAMLAKFRASGQSCIAANRFLVHRSILEPFVARLLECIERLEVGDGMRNGVDVGPLINARAVARLEDQLAEARRLGANVLYGGHRLSPPGHFFAPTLVRDVSMEMSMAHEEIFGPVLAVMAFDDDAEALRIANATRYGLASYLYSRDMARIIAFSERLEFGMVGVNCGLISSATVPFGGIKESGMGREGSGYGIDEYVSLKYVALGGLPAGSGVGG